MNPPDAQRSESAMGFVGSHGSPRDPWNGQRAAAQQKLLEQLVKEQQETNVLLRTLLERLTPPA